MMCPVPRGRIRRTASRVLWITPCRLTSSWRVVAVSGSSASGDTGSTAALLIRMSRGPRVCSTWSRAV